MNSSDEAVDPELRQIRLSRFGRVLAAITLGFVVTSISVSRASFLEPRELHANFGTLLLAMAAAAFSALWLLLRGAPRSPRFVRAVELATLFLGTRTVRKLAMTSHAASRW